MCLNFEFVQTKKPKCVISVLIRYRDVTSFFFSVTVVESPNSQKENIFIEKLASRGNFVIRKFSNYVIAAGTKWKDSGEEERLGSTSAIFL